MTALLAIVALAALAAVVVVAMNTVKRRKAVAALPPAEREHYDAIRAARKELRSATRDHDSAVRGVERDLGKAQKPQKLASVGGHTLFDDSVKTPSGTHRLTDAVTATVDTAGNLATKSRSTLTRMGAGAVIAGPLGLLVGATAKKSQTIDKRELYLLIDGGEWASVEQLNPDHGADARKFAQAVNVAARQVETVTRQRAERVHALTRRLEEVRGDRGRIETATTQVARLEATASPAVAELLLKNPSPESVALPAG